MTTMARKQSPLRSPESRLAFCERYFSEVGAVTTHQSNNYREYTLPADVDKEMTDRPYYWLWMEKMGQEPQPSILRLAFTEEAEQLANTTIRERAIAAAGPSLSDIQRQYFVAPKSELVNLGSFRLDKIYASCEQRGRFATVMPAETTSPDQLVPWLLVNIRVSQRCDITEQSVRSFGICLVNGQRIEGFYKMIERIRMKPMHPSLVASKMSVSIRQALDTLHRTLTDQLVVMPHAWASAAQDRLNKDIIQIQTYYESLRQDFQSEDWDNVALERERKIRDVQARSKPRIELDVTQLALIGLLDHGVAH